MTRHERLMENYEDALFALLMEPVMVREGERLESLNRRLREDPAAAVPETVNRRCLEAIRRWAAAQKRRCAFRGAGRVLRTAAVLAVMGAVLFTTAFAVSEEFREASLRLVRTVTGAYTQLDMSRSGESGAASPGGTGKAEGYFRRIELGWVPEGFTYRGGEYDRFAEFENGQGDWFRLSLYSFNFYGPDDIHPPEEIQYPYAFENITVHGGPGACLTKDGVIQASYQDLAHDLTVQVLTSAGFDKETALSILEHTQPVHGGPNGSGYFENTEIRWLPEGFAFQEGRYDWYVKFENPAGERIWVYMYAGSGSVSIDTEGAEQVEEVTINENEGLCVFRDGSIHIVTADLAHHLYIDVIASDTLSVATVNKVVENIIVLDGPQEGTES